MHPSRVRDKKGNNEYSIIIVEIYFGFQIKILVIFLMERKRNGIGGHQSATMRTDEWLTPPEIIRALGDFDLDPCSPINRPWDTAGTHYTLIDDGLHCDWSGRVWLNPPYSREAEKWLKKLADHGNGIALIFARTETEAFFREVWRRATSVLFIEGRLYFYKVDGTRASANAGAPSVLIAYDQYNSEILERSTIKGKFIKLK